MGAYEAMQEPKAQSADYSHMIIHPVRLTRLNQPTNRVRVTTRVALAYQRKSERKRGNSKDQCLRVKYWWMARWLFQEKTTTALGRHQAALRQAARRLAGEVFLAEARLGLVVQAVEAPGTTMTMEAQAMEAQAVVAAAMEAQIAEVITARIMVREDLAPTAGLRTAEGMTTTALSLRLEMKMAQMERTTEKDMTTITEMVTEMVATTTTMMQAAAATTTVAQVSGTQVIGDVISGFLTSNNGVALNIR